MDMNRNDLFIPAEEIHFLFFSFFFSWGFFIWFGYGMGLVGLVQLGWKVGEGEKEAMCYY